MSSADPSTSPEAPRPVVKPSKPATTGDTVTVACKMPGGLQLRIFTKEEYMEPMRDGTHKQSWRAVQVGDPFVLRGPWVQSGGRAFEKNLGLVAELLPGGYALTEGVPRDLWETWLEQNKGSKLVTNRIVFAAASSDAAKKEARGGDHATVRTGLEPLDPLNPSEKLGRIDRRLKIERSDEAA